MNLDELRKLANDASVIGGSILIGGSYMMALLDRVEELEEALRFYADRTGPRSVFGRGCTTFANIDNGERARQALEDDQ